MRFNDLVRTAPSSSSAERSNKADNSFERLNSRMQPLKGCEEVGNVSGSSLLQHWAWVWGWGPGAKWKRGSRIYRFVLEEGAQVKVTSVWSLPCPPKEDLIAVGRAARLSEGWWRVWIWISTPSLRYKEPWGLWNSLCLNHNLDDAVSALWMAKLRFYPITV